MMFQTLTYPPIRFPLWSWPGLIFRMLARALGADTMDAAQAEARFSEVTRCYRRLIAGICLSFSNCQEDFDDLQQDTLLNIWKGLPYFRSDSAISTWIYRVTLNTCVSFQRKSRKVDELSMQQLYMELYDNSQAEEIEQYSLMYRLIGMLKPIDKSIILMWLDGNSYDDIADVVGLSRNAVASRLKRAKDSLATMHENIKQ